MKKFILIGLFACLHVGLITAQVAINTTGAPPDNSALLDVSTTVKGLLIPRMTQAQRNAISLPASGLLVYQTDNTPGYYFNSGIPVTPVWQRLGELVLPWAGTVSTSINDPAFSVTNTGGYYGIIGQSSVEGGVGVMGNGYNNDGGVGVMGQCMGTTGIGVWGYDNSINDGPSIGVKGETESENGYGVYGLANTIYGENYAVYGQANGFAGYSGYFTGGRFYVDGNVGIGTTMGGYPLMVKSTGSSTVIADFENSANNPLIRLRESSNGSGGLYLFDGSNTSTIFLYGDGNSYINSGNLGIGTGSPTELLDVNGNARFRAIGSGAYAGPVNRTSNGTLTTATSDVRLKENIHTLQNSLDKVMRLRGVSFTWKADPGMGTRIGFIAQEFEKIIPELVFTNETDGYKGINYAEVSAVLAEAVKELKTQVDSLTAANRRLDERLMKLESQMRLTARK
jgi:hypothetical protein